LFCNTFAPSITKACCLALEYIENYFKEQGQEMTPNNKQQALVIEGAKVLQPLNKVITHSLPLVAFHLVGQVTK
jgi:molybdopterin-biosynthesis enzyme MoeA-like protein